jgi:hypothetical protein
MDTDNRMLLSLVVFTVGFTLGQSHYDNTNDHLIGGPHGKLLQPVLSGLVVGGICWMAYPYIKAQMS